MDREDLELFERGLDHATGSWTGSALDDALVELGWGEALAAERQAAVATLFELQGRANATSSALAAVVRDGLGVGNECGIVMPWFGNCIAPGVISGDHVLVRGIASSTMVNASTTLVVGAAGEEHVGVVIKTQELSIRPLAGLDPSLGLVEITGDARSVDQTSVDWSAAVRRGQLAMSHELIGTSRAMLEMACEHALERVQFGVPISSFQAIRHRLAETLVAIETAQAMLGEAWEDDDPQTTAMAKALAGRAGRTTARHCQQVLAGIGFTLEHRFHHYFRRALVLDELFGSARVLTRELGQQLIHTRQLPPVLPL